MKTLKQYFTPGRVVKRYGGGFDKIIRFTENPKPGFEWEVEVIAVTQDGLPIPGAYNRVHATMPTRREQEDE